MKLFAIALCASRKCPGHFDCVWQVNWKYFAQHLACIVWAWVLETSNCIILMFHNNNSHYDIECVTSKKPHFLRCNSIWMESFVLYTALDVPPSPPWRPTTSPHVSFFLPLNCRSFAFLLRIPTLYFYFSFSFFLPTLQNSSFLEHFSEPLQLFNFILYVKKAICLQLSKRSI